MSAVKELNEVSIAMDTELHPSQDFQVLRDAGMEYIRQLSGAIWTDHNLHDPGITTLEVLCFAITDLGYRSDFPIADLMTGQSGFNTDPAQTSFFPAQEALTNTALTPLDYRKLLLKIDGIRNAWMLPRLVAPGSEIPVYVDRQDKQLSLSDKDSTGHANNPLFINGLYDVRLELVPHVEWGSMNETTLPLDLRYGAFIGCDGRLSLVESIAEHRALWAQVAAENVTAPDLVASLTLMISDQDARSIKIRCRYKGEDLPELSLVLNTKKSGFAEADWLDLLNSETDSPLIAFARKQAAISVLLAKAACALQDSRNLCEDFASIDTISSDYIAICSDIEVSPEADLEEVQAQVYFAIEQYLNPPVPNYTLKELLNSGLDADAIFDGPYINHELMHDGAKVFNKPGFTLNEELKAADLRKMIHSSDIINLLMDIEHVVNVKSLTLRKYAADGKAIGSSEPWCLAVAPGHQPVLSIDYSNILFLKKNVPFLARSDEFEATLRHLRAVANKNAYGDLQESLIVPHGRIRDTLTHYPIQHDFPLTYQIGEAGLEANADSARAQKAQQFKGYLTVFEQVLGDYLAQLANLPNLFSLDKSLQQSYFSQYLTNIAGSRGQFEDEFYVDKNLFADDSKRARLRESHEAFQDRRHRLLDHLLARFAERFTDYVMLMLRNDDQTLLTSAELINDKIDFLRQQPILSRERNRAFNYKPTDLSNVWDSDNVSGLEKRGARLAGFDDYRRRNLSCVAFMNTLMDTRRTGDEFRLEIKDKNNKLLFKSYELFPTRELAMAAANSLFAGIESDASFTPDVNGDGEHIWHLHYGSVSLLQDKKFKKLAEVKADIKKVRQRITEVFAELGAMDEELPDNDAIADIVFDTREYGRDYRVEIKDVEQNILFKAKELFASRVLAQKAAKSVFPGVKDPANYKIDASGGVGAVCFSLVFDGVELTHDVLFDNANDARRAIDAIVARYYEVLLGEVCDDEGLYLIEHLLLRPRSSDSELFDVCVDGSGTACSDEDPYSFRASVVLPYWPSRFQSLTFRNFFENLIREQAPAHVQLKICWVDHLQMESFEQALQKWLIALKTESFGSSILVEAQNQLLTLLQQLRSVFPTAELHDCDDDNSGEPVRLGSTNLGVF